MNCDRVGPTSNGIAVLVEVVCNIKELAFGAVAQVWVGHASSREGDVCSWMKACML